MCGRFALSVQTEQVEKLLPELYGSVNIVPNFNVTPGRNIAAITNTESYSLSFLHWGLIPSWAKDSSSSFKMINARAENMFVKPMYKKLISQRRCLILASGFYEWKKEQNSNTKTPYYIKMKSDELITFAGLWDSWIHKETGELIKSTTIITTEANSEIKPVHHRMPVVISEKLRTTWLHDKIDEDDFINIVNQKNSIEFELYEVSKLVNSPINNSVENIRPLRKS